MKLKKMVVLAILLEGNEGIARKSPSYIKEKMWMVENVDDEEMLVSLLDDENRIKYKKWKEFWDVE